MIDFLDNKCYPLVMVQSDNPIILSLTAEYVCPQKLTVPAPSLGISHNSLTKQERNRKWREANPDYQREWRAKNPTYHTTEKQKEYKKAWREKNPQANIKRAWAIKNPEKVALYSKRYALKYPDKIKKARKIGTHKRRARLKGNGGSFTFAEWELLKKQYNHTCPLCKKKEPTIALTIDHSIAVSKGGSNYIEDIQPLCLLCNKKKHTKCFKINKNSQFELLFR